MIVKVASSAWSLEQGAWSKGAWINHERHEHRSAWVPGPFTASRDGFYFLAFATKARKARGVIALTGDFRKSRELRVTMHSARAAIAALAWSASSKSAMTRLRARRASVEATGQTSNVANISSIAASALSLPAV